MFFSIKFNEIVSKTSYSIGSDVCVGKLLGKGANVGVKDNHGKTALDYAEDGNSRNKRLKEVENKIPRNFSNTIALLIEADSSAGNGFTLNKLT